MRSNFKMGRFAPTRPRMYFYLISVLWYLALYPGRLGFDYSEAIRMMQKGESTSWWTSSYWWFLRLSTFNGRSIALSALISLAVLAYSVIQLSESIPMKEEIRNKSLFIFASLPLYGAFGVNVSHDVFLASAILLFTALNIREFTKERLNNRQNLAIASLATCLAITTHYGVFIVLVNAVIFALIYRIKVIALVVPLAIVVMTVASFGVTKVPTYGPVLPIIADLKCIAQHPSAEISEAEWSVLTDYAPRSQWEKATSCAMVDVQIQALSSLDLANVKLTPELIKTYIGIVGRNSAIPAMAHFQRASVALPPPFFAGQPNQVPLDPSIPIGEGTNTALQTNAEVLHPSIDEPSVNKKIVLLKPLEIIAQALIFVINQASWFWGWGGLWLWPFSIFLIFFLKKKSNKSIIPIAASTITLHLLLLVLASPLPRYVMSTILMGIYFFIVQAMSQYDGYKNR